MTPTTAAYKKLFDPAAETAIPAQKIIVVTRTAVCIEESCFIGSLFFIITGV